MEQDSYLTIEQAVEGEFTEKRSRFLSFAIPVRTVDEVREHVSAIQRQYHDARHVCYAYMIGAERTQFRANDNGEPSGTAGKPILGQINSAQLSDVLVVVVRYFGGIKLGTGGLIVAYRQAALEALQKAEVVTRLVEEQVSVAFEYPLMNSVMRVVKEEGPTILSQSFEMDCRMTLSIRASLMPALMKRLEALQLDGLRIEQPD